MKATVLSESPSISRIKLFLALSRTPHGLLDLATPSLGALLGVGTLPPGPVVALGLVTAFAGYTAVYALNDLVDYRRDREAVRGGGFQAGTGHLDAVWIRHPIAQGVLGFREGLVWAATWGAVALFGAYRLNPMCAILLLAGCALEALYCALQDVTHLRILVSGVVKTLGGVAAVFAVDPSPSPMFLVALFLWIFFWEVGGQNIPNDWHDLEEDRRTRARTLPVRFGSRWAAAVSLGSVCITVALSWLLLRLAPAGLPAGVAAVGGLAGLYWLVLPAVRLQRTQARRQASALFNSASYYPLVMLLLVLIGLVP